MAVRQLTQEIVGLRGNHAQPAYLAEQPGKTLTLCPELDAGFTVVALIFVKNLHIELGERVDVPNGHIFFYGFHQFLVATGQHTQAQARHAVALADALHHHKTRVGSQQIIVKQ